MKQLLFLLLFPCLCVAQYTGNAGQKITLGEQTTADGLVYRGQAFFDTVTVTSKITRANKQDTSAFLLLDTVTNLLWHYKIGSNGWIQAGGGGGVTSFSAGTTGLTPSTATTGAVTLGGTLAVANGGTGKSALTANKVLVGSGTDTIKSPTNLHWDNTHSRLGIGLSNPTVALDVAAPKVQFRLTSTTGTNAGYALFANSGTNFYFGIDGNTGQDFDATNSNSAVLWNGGATPMLFATSNIRRMIITSAGDVGIGTGSPAVQFHTTSNVRFAGLASITDLRTDADGDLFNGSDFNLKNSIDTINFGLSDVLKLKPVSFNWNDEARNINEYKSMGFIAQDIMDVIPNAASTMGDGDMQVDYNAIVATLTKAIQEQNSLIKALEQRLLILENK